jgi:hypothetical protein
MRQTAPTRDSAPLVRGRDRSGHFNLEQLPLSDMHPAAIAHHDQVVERSLHMLYAGSRRREPA